MGRDFFLVVEAEEGGRRGAEIGKSGGWKLERERLNSDAWDGIRKVYINIHRDD